MDKDTVRRNLCWYSISKTTTHVYWRYAGEGAYLVHLVEVVEVLLWAATLGVSLQKRVNEVADGVVADGFVECCKKERVSSALESAIVCG